MSSGHVRPTGRTIGVHRVIVTALEPPTSLRVRALEAIEGTPIIDLKIAMRESPEA